MGMSLLLVTRYFPPLDSIATNRMVAWARRLTQLGHRVTVLTTSKEGQVVCPNRSNLPQVEVVEIPYFDPLVAVGARKEAWSQGNSQGHSWKSAAIRFYRHRMNERLPGRTDPWILPARRQLLRWREEGREFDWVISSYGPPSAHVIGHVAKGLFSCPWLADYRDLWVENHVFKGLFPFTLFERWLERFLLKRVDVVTTVSPGLAAVLQKKIGSKPVHVVENGFDAEAMDGATTQFFAQEPPTTRMVYTGSIYPGKRDPSPLFQAIAEMKGELPVGRFQVNFYGSQSGNLAALIEKYGVSEWVRDSGCVAQDEAYAIQKSCDALLFLEDGRPTVDGILTGKLFEYLYTDRPILGVGVTLNTAPGKLIADMARGEVWGNEVEGIKGFLRRLLQGDLAFPGNREAIERYSRQRQGDALEGLLRQYAV